MIVILGGVCVEVAALWFLCCVCVRLFVRLCFISDDIGTAESGAVLDESAVVALCVCGFRCSICMRVCVCVPSVAVPVVDAFVESERDFFDRMRTWANCGWYWLWASFCSTVDEACVNNTCA